MTESQELTLDELVEEFEFLGDWGEQCRYLIELGEQLPDLPESEKIEAYRVVGCLSRVWLVPEPRTDHEHVWFHAKSDGRLVDGLIVIVSLLFNGKSPTEILETDVRVPFKKLGLESHLAMQRRNGLQAMVERVRDLARTVASARPAGESHKLPADQSAGWPSNPATLSTQVPVAVMSPGQVRTEPNVAPTRAFDVMAARGQFPALQHVNPAGLPIVYLDSASSSQKPQVVIDKETEVYEQYYANAYRGVYRFGDRVSQELEAVREKVATFIGAESSEEIFFTSGTTMGMNLVANAWGRKFLKAGDEILLTMVEHHANIVPWHWVAEQTGAVVRFAPLAGDGQLDLEQFDKLVTERTRVISITGLSNVLGTITPLEHVSAQARRVGALLVVDGAQSVPHLPIDVVRQHVDFMAFSGHKLYGPSGVGVGYGRRDLLESMDPFLCGGHMISTVSVDGFTLARAPAKFEAGTLPIAQAIALGAAIDYVQALGLDVIHAPEQQVLAYAFEQMSQIDGLKIYGPSIAERGGIIPFTVDGAAAQDIASLLDVHGVCVRHGHHCTMPLHDWLGVPATIRASFGLYNTTADVDALVSGLKSAREILKLT
ncbi:MAG: SufS family cysteine desulfurase [Pirellulaceae bacterium]|nr:SufS family cysteine desulfurase [Pirellulaceae bacterium]